jgi:outer membrane protein OmpA-like peptidoglycan-associated protein
MRHLPASFVLLRRQRLAISWALLPVVVSALDAQTPPSASSIPFAPGVVLTYVMHNLDEKYDREFNSAIVAVSPEETEFAVDMQYRGAGGKAVQAVYHRHQSRRELLGARAIDHGGTCNPADTLDTRYRGSTLLMASQRVLRQLKTGETVDVRSWYIPGECAPGVVVSGTIRRVEPGPVPVSILLNGQRLDLSTIHARGMFSSFDFGQMSVEYWFLDDDQRPWLIRVEGQQEKKSYMQQLGRVVLPDREAEDKMAAALAKGGACRASIYGIYFEFASAELKAASVPTLRQIASVMQQHPDWTITIEGHTDSIGGAASNLELSKRRAAAVKEELSRRYGVPAARLSTEGYGLARPLAPNKSMEGRAQNRRVELSRRC